MDHDLGMLIIRLGLGLMLIAHGANKVFGGGGLAGTERWFAGLGMRPAWVHARLAAATELGAGALFAFGLLTGLAGMGFVGLMYVAARTDHRGNGFFMFKNGFEYVMVVGLVAVGVVAAGPGKWSLDHAFGLDLAGGWWALIAALGGVAAGTALLAATYRPTPKPAGNGG